MANLRDIQSIAHNRHLASLAIDRIVGSEKFAALFAKCSESEQLQAEQFVVAGNRDGLEAWMRQHTRLENLPVRELHQLAQSLGIRNYKRISTSTLLAEIRNASVCQCKKVQSSDDGNHTKSACCEGSEPSDSEFGRAVVKDRTRSSADHE